MNESVSVERRSLLRWLFEDRRTGQIVVAQWPNAALWVWIAATGLTWSAHPHGPVGTTLRVIGFIALVVWALDEIVRGVNPWRRSLGAGVLGFVMVRAVMGAM